MNTIKNRPSIGAARLEQLETRRLLSADVTTLPIGSTLFFSTQVSPGQWQLSESNLDGSQPTVLQTFVSQPGWFTNDNGKLIFAADAGDLFSGNELWTSDGTPAGTTMVADIYPGSQSSNPHDFFLLNGNVVFTATDTTLNQSFFTTDGTTDGTQPLIPLNSFHTSPANALVQDNVLYFEEFVQNTGETQRYQSDGTTAGTQLSSGGLIVNNTLSVFGTNNADDIEISSSGGTTTVSIAGVDSHSFDNSDFTSISVSALNGNDTVNVSDDVLVPMTIDGGSGDDSMQGGGGNDRITGDDGNDTLLGGAGNDSINGGLGSDSLNGGAGNDNVADSSTDQTDANTLLGGDGNDTLHASFGIDSLAGGSGNDHLIAGFDSGTYDGGAGFDILDFAGNFPMTKSSDAQTITTTIGPADAPITATHTYVAIEKLIGSDNDDVINLSPNDSVHVVEGGAGNDSILGTLGNDQLFGNDGDDTLSGAGGVDTFDGGAGNDSIISDANDKIIGEAVSSDPPANGILRINGTSGDDQIIISLNASDATMLQVSVNGTINTYNVADITLIQIVAGAGNDNVKFDETNGPITIASKIYGGDGDDTIIGGSGSDRIYGGDGNDWISGGAGNDILYGEAGNDRLFGGAGKDFLDGGAGSNVIRGEAGINTIVSESILDDLRGNKGSKMIIET